jgi:hypothetical protein
VTWAEGTGLGQLWKDIITGVTEKIKDMTHAMDENQKADSGKREFGVTINENTLKYAEDELYLLKVTYGEYDVLISKLKELEDAHAGMAYGTRIAELQKQIDYYETVHSEGIETYKNWKNIVAAQKRYLEDQEERNAREEAWEKTVDDLQKIFGENVSKINSVYEKTDEGRLEAIKKQIEEFEAMRGMSQYQGDYSVEYDHGEIETLPQLEGMDDGQKKQLEIAIQSLYDEQKKLLDKGNEEVKAKLTDWQELLKGIFHFDGSDVESFLAAGKQGIDGIEKFAARTETAREGAAQLSEILGADLSSALEGTAQSWEKVLEALVTSDVEWGGKAQLLAKAREEWEKASADAKEARGDEYLAELQKAYDLSKLEREDRELQLETEKNINKETAKQAVALQKAEKANTHLNELKEQGTLILLKQKSLYDYNKQTLANQGMGADTDANLQQMQRNTYLELLGEQTKRGARAGLSIDERELLEIMDKFVSREQAIEILNEKKLNDADEYKASLDEPMSTG